MIQIQKIMFTFKIGIKSQVSKHVPSAKSTSRMPRDVPNKPMAPAGGEGLLSHFAVCVWRWSAGFAVCFVGPTTTLSCFLLFLFFFFCFWRMWTPISRGVSDLSISFMASITQISSSSLRFFCACSSGDMTTSTAIVWRTVFKKPENCLHFSMEPVSFSFNARGTEFSSHRRIWFLTAISLLNLFVLVFLSSFFIQCIWTVFQRCASRSAYIVFAVFFLKSPGIPQFFG